MRLRLPSHRTLPTLSIRHGCTLSPPGLGQEIVKFNSASRYRNCGIKFTHRVTAKWLRSSFWVSQRALFLQSLAGDCRKVTCTVASEPAVKEEMAKESPKEIFLKDYKLPDYYFDTKKKIKKQKNGIGLVGAAEQEMKAFETFACPIESHKVIEIEIAESEPAVGMRKWLSEYHNQRPGLHVLQQHIDEFIADFEAREERARQEREAAAAEEGWTVVTRHKGRKKTTDSESGITVGGIAPAAVENKQKKKTTETALNFYRFQRREARRNEILELQQRFEEDKKKIVALRAARKFRPY